MLSVHRNYQEVSANDVERRENCYLKAKFCFFNLRQCNWQKKILGARGAPVASLDPKMALGIHLGGRLWVLISIPADCSCPAPHTQGYAASPGLGDLSSPTRDQTQPLVSVLCWCLRW